MSRLTSFRTFGKHIIGIGRNYRDHALELGNPVPTEPVVFLKPVSSYISQGQPIVLPFGSKAIHHEVELGVVIGLAGRDIEESDAMKHIGGYVLALDMTDRVRQDEAKRKGLSWLLAKGFDTSCPVSSLIDKEIITDPHAVNLWLKVNGQMRQQGNTRDMIFSIPHLISWLSRHMSLCEGDLILTGTPSGVGPVSHGDTIECGLDDIVTLTFSVTSKQ